MNVHQFMRASADHADRCEDAMMIFIGGEGKAPVFAVIDGMGGHQRQLADGTLITGREAAQLARQTFIEDLQHLPAEVSAAADEVAHQQVVASLCRAHARIYSELNSSDDIPLNQRVGAVATIVVVCENGTRLLVGQVGDTRAYLFSGDELIQLCYDEDNIEYLIGRGMISPEDGARISNVLNTFDGVQEPVTEGVVIISGNAYEMYLAWRWFVVGNTALRIPSGNIVIKSLGISDELPTPQLSRMELSPDERLFLCSDGIYKNLTEQEMTDFIIDGGDSATAMGEAAFARSTGEGNRRSTRDDISAMVVDFSV